MRILARTVLTVVSCLCLAAEAVAQPAVSVPRVVRISATFHPANGLPPSPVEVVTLSIYADETGGAPLWSETQNVSVDAEGRFTLLLGSTVTDGLPLDLFASGEARWLGMTFERPGEAERQRTLLASVPYALRASDADTLGGQPASAFLLRTTDAKKSTRTTGSTTTGTAAAGDPAAAADVFGTQNFIAKFTSTSDVRNSSLYDTGSRIGVNTIFPFDALHVRVTDTTGGFTGIAVQNLASSATSYSGMLFYDQDSALGMFQGFNNSTHEYRINNVATGGTINFLSGSTSRLFVASGGNVGIGVAAPAQKLDVAGDLNTTGDLRRNNQVYLRLNTAGLNNLSLGLSNAAATVGSDNTLVGAAGGQNLAAGINNTAVGSSALKDTTSSNGNVALGAFSMQGTSGTGNVVVGAFGANAKPSGDFNIYLGYNIANDALNVEDRTIRIGDSAFTARAFMNGIRGVTTGAADAVAVMIDSNGQLGTINSSRRYKEEIRDMGDASSGLMKLRPVTFRYKEGYANGSKPIEYGLIAEEVEAIYPDLVAHLADGEVETVQYHKINAMLLNEIQKQHREIEMLQQRLEALEKAAAPK